MLIQVISNACSTIERSLFKLSEFICNIYDVFSLRAQFSVEGAEVNMLHGSDSEESAQKEIEYFFPMEQTVAMIKPDAFGTKGKTREYV